MIYINSLIVPIIILFIIFYGFFKKVNIYDTFLNGCIDGFKLMIEISPTIITIVFVIEIFVKSNIVEIIFKGFNLFSPHLISMAILRPISGNASLALMKYIFKLYGPDSLNGFIASLLQGSTETTFYVVALYYGTVKINKFRNTLRIGLIVDLIGIILAFILGYIFYNHFI